LTVDFATTALWKWTVSPAATVTPRSAVASEVSLPERTRATAAVTAPSAEIVSFAR